MTQLSNFNSHQFIQQAWDQLPACDPQKLFVLLAKLHPGKLRTDELIKDIRLVAYAPTESVTVAYAVRDDQNQVVNVLYSKYGVHQPPHYWLLSFSTDIVGCAIQFGGVREELALTTNVEAALKAATEKGIPCWACLGLTGLRTVRLPGQVKNVTVLRGQHDSGDFAEVVKELTQRFLDEGRRVSVKQE